MTTPDQVMTCVIAGMGLDLDGGPRLHGYELHGDTRSQRAISWRKQTVESAWVEGSYDVAAVRNNITELVAVWVYGSSQNDFWKKVYALADAIATPAFAITWTVDGMTEVWDCTFSDYTVETQREFQYAKQGVMRMNIVRRPRTTITYADATTYAG